MIKKIAIVLALFSLAASSRVSVAAPSRAAGKTGRTASKQAAKGGGSADRERFRQDFIDSTKQYQASLQAVAASYSEQLKALTERNATLKDLFSKGLISRVEMEKSDQAVAEARAKIDGLQGEVKSADAALQAAINPGSGSGYGGVIGTSTNWTTGNKNIDGLIRHYGARYNVDPYLIYLVMHRESGFSPSAVSPKGAQGLMQLMPGTAARYGVTKPSDPTQSIMGGAHYLSDLLQLFNGNVSLALAGYNAGEGAVMKYGNRVPPYHQTRYYVQDISRQYRAKQKNEDTSTNTGGR